MSTKEDSLKGLTKEYATESLTLFTHHATNTSDMIETIKKMMKENPNVFKNQRPNTNITFPDQEQIQTIPYKGEPVRYMYTIIGGGWCYTSQAYFVTDNKVYHVKNFKQDMLKMKIADIPFTNAINIDTTKLDFKKHDSKIAMDTEYITMYQYVDNKYERLWKECYIPMNSEAVNIVNDAFRKAKKQSSQSK